MSNFVYKIYKNQDVTPKIGSEERHNGLKNDIFGIGYTTNKKIPTVGWENKQIPSSHYNNIHYMYKYDKNNLNNQNSKNVWIENVYLPNLIQDRLYYRRRTDVTDAYYKSVKINPYAW